MELFENCWFVWKIEELQKGSMWSLYLFIIDGDSGPTFPPCNCATCFALSRDVVLLHRGGIPAAQSRQRFGGHLEGQISQIIAHFGTE